ncbi:unnamed protein product [Arabis nemorensis]|uniref:Uncharacterized protein n=1 Tax=Arabis nemorensis TaxID=586526 RepID=A0A565BIV2_9BRAS|nr:unnamed protein product [Arabis nemorensis]
MSGECQNLTSSPEQRSPEDLSVTQTPSCRYSWSLSSPESRESSCKEFLVPSLQHFPGETGASA